MPVAFAQPPEAVEELTRTKIQEIARDKGFRVASLATAQPGQVSLGSGHPVYNLGLRDIVGATPVAQLPITSWRFIVQHEGAEATAAETLGAGPSRQPEFSSVNQGPFVSGTTNAFAAIAKDPAFADGNWEMRLLRVPALYVYAIWTHDTRGGGDRLRPVDPAPACLNAARSYTWDEFLSALRPEAEKRLAADDGMKG